MQVWTEQLARNTELLTFLSNRAKPGVRLAHIPQGKSNQPAFLKRFNQTFGEVGLNQHPLSSLQASDRFWMDGRRPPDVQNGAIRNANDASLPSVEHFIGRLDAGAYVIEAVVHSLGIAYEQRAVDRRQNGWRLTVNKHVKRKSVPMGKLV